MRAWLIRWRLAIRIARRDARQHRGRTVLVVLMMMLPITAAAFLVGFVTMTQPSGQTRAQWNLGTSARAVLEASGTPRVPIRQDAGGMSASSHGGTDLGPLTEADLLDALPPDSQLTRAVALYANIRTSDVLIPGSEVLEVDPMKVPGLLGTDAPTGELATNEAFISTSLAERLHVQTGGKFEIAIDHSYREITVEGVGGDNPNLEVVVGSGTLRASAGAGNEVDSNESTNSRQGPDAGAGTRDEPAEGSEKIADGAFTSWFVTSGPAITWPDVVRLNEIGVSVLSREVLIHPPSDSEVYGGEFATGNTNSWMVGFVLAAAGLGFLEAVLLIGPAFAVGARRITRTLALVAASGGRPSELRRIVLAMGLVTGTIAAVGGIVLGIAADLIVYVVFAASGHPLVNFALPFTPYLLIGAIALVIGVSAAFIPAINAAKADVVTVLTQRRSSTDRPRRTPWVGLAITALGAAGLAAAAATGEPVLLAGSAIAVELGIVLLIGTILIFIGRLAPRLRLGARFALRDAVRHRSRTAPAIAAVVAAVAAMTVGTTMAVSNDRADLASTQPLAATGTGIVTFRNYDADASLPESDTNASDEDARGSAHSPGAANSVNSGAKSVPALLQPSQDSASYFSEVKNAITSVLGNHQVTPVTALTQDSSTDLTPPLLQQNPQTLCPDGKEISRNAKDSRCRDQVEQFFGTDWPGIYLVDDGTLVSQLDLDGSDSAARALAQGEVLVNNEEMIWPDGNAHLSTFDSHGEEAEVLKLPAHLVPWGSRQYSLVLSFEAAAQLPSTESAKTALESGELTPQVVGAVITGTPLTQADIDQINRSLADDQLLADVSIAGAQPQQSRLIALLLLAVGSVIALAATALSAGLAIADSRPDLATLSAVGASPRVRRRVTAAQAGVIAGIGTLVGVATGIALSYVLGAWASRAFNYGDIWITYIQWPLLAAAVIGLPLIAIVGGYLLPHSRLPLLRR